MDLCGLAAMGATNAAAAMNVDGETGAITPGLFADLVLLNNQLEVEVTIVRGVTVYRRAEVAV